MRIGEVIELVADLSLAPGDYAVFGSGPLLVRGIIDEVNDIDILARGTAWQQALGTGSLIELPEHGVSVVSLNDGLLTIGSTWAIGDVDVDEAIESAETIAGLPWVRLALVGEYKRVAGRPKDIQHLRLLDEWLESGEDDPSTSLGK